MISRDEILKGQVCPPELEENLKALLEALNKFRTVYGIPMYVTSGYRTPEHNAKIGGAKNSSHMFCQAADFEDVNRELTKFCLTHLDVLAECGLWMEDPTSTPPKGDRRTPWVHLQIRPAHKRVFTP